LRSLHITIQLVPKHLQTRDQPPDAPPEISSINYCQPLRAPLPIDAPVKVYSALAKFEELLSRPEARFEHILAEGDCAVFDNRRVLHARAAFWDRNALEGDADEINRWLKGCYVEKDDLLNRTRGLLAKRDSNSCDY
jgi:gamma-butyrobetaine dioxygenase